MGWKTTRSACCRRTVSIRAAIADSEASRTRDSADAPSAPARATGAGLRRCGSDPVGPVSAAASMRTRSDCWSRCSPNAAAHALRELLWVTGLREEAEQPAVVDCSDCGVDVGVTGQQNAHCARRDTSHLSEQVRAGQSWHAHIGDDDRESGGLAPEQCERLSAVSCNRHVEAATQEVTKPLPNILLIVYAQQSRERPQ